MLITVYSYYLYKSVVPPFGGAADFIIKASLFLNFALSCSFIKTDEEFFAQKNAL